MENEKFKKEKNMNLLLALRLKLFDYKIKKRKDISMKLLEKDLNLEEYLTLLNISKAVKEYLKEFYKCKKLNFFKKILLDNYCIDDFSNYDARSFLNTFRRNEEAIYMNKDIRPKGEFKNSYHVKINSSQEDFSNLINYTCEKMDIFHNKNFVDSAIIENLFNKKNQLNRLIFCGNLENIKNNLPENVNISNKLRYDLYDLDLLLEKNKKYYYEFVLKFEDNNEYENFKKKTNGYFYHFQEKNIFFIFQNNLFGEFMEKDYYKIIIKTDKEYKRETLINFFDKIFEYNIKENILLCNKFSIENKSPLKGYYFKYVELFYKYFEQNIILFFSDSYKYNINNLMIEEFMISEGILNLIEDGK